ncbi:hypothetical protein [Streptomyces sp. NPDC001165]|uniref:hypothetical protein n=1 Tax=Streptomyces sp. NPDC001165 TaxID=3364546 RepID=UPI0036CF24AE
MRRRHIAAAAALLGAVACTAQEKPVAHAVPSASAPSCRSGAIRWRTTATEWRLTEVSAVVTVGKSDVRAKKYAHFEFPAVHVRTVTASVETSAPSVSGRRVLASLADRLGEDVSMLGRPGRTTVHRKQDLVTVDLRGVPGRFVEADGVHVVQASFTVTCPGRDTDLYGSVTTWDGDGSALLRCGEHPGKDAWVREGYRLACGTTSTPAAAAE